MVRARQQTIRQEIINLLSASPMTLRDISQALSIAEKEAAGHLPSVEKTVRTKGRKLKVAPYHCQKCGFEFRSRKNFKKPGKCPDCKQGRIAPAEFRIL